MLRLQAIIFLFLSLSLISITIYADSIPPPLPTSIIPLDQNESSIYQQLKLAETTIQLRMENLRLSVCLHNNISQKECGGWTQQGTIQRNVIVVPIPKIKDKEDSKK